MIYEKNLECLKNKHGHIYKAIIDRDFEWDETRVSICDAKNQEKIVVYNTSSMQVYLNSKYNPSKEAEKYMEDLVGMKERSVLTMFGLSNGCFVREILEKANNDITIIVYEPSIDIFMAVIKSIDISDILSNEKIGIVVADINMQMYKNLMGGMLRSYNKDSCRHIVLPKYGELFSDQCAQLVTMTNEIYDELQMLANTLESSGRDICKNNIMNMKYLYGCKSGMDFVGAFPEDMPAIIVSAGPSLAQNKHLLSQAKGKALIIVVDTAIKQVMSIGIKPDMVISVDYAKDLKYFDQEGLQEIPFVAEADSSVDVLDMVKPRDVIFCGADSVLWEGLFEKVGSEIRYLDRGGSVATVAIACAINWGFKRIILIGQDLTFTGGVVHAGEQAKEFDFSTGHYSYVEGINGEQLVTRMDYLAYLRWIENMAYRFQNVEFIDATEGGALIANTTVMTFQDAIDKYCQNVYDVENIIYSVPKLFEGENSKLVEDSLQRMKENLGSLKRRLTETALDCRTGSKMLSRGDYNLKGLKKINASIEKMDNYLLESEESVLFSKLDSSVDEEFQQDVFDVEDDDIKESIRLYEKYEKYYNGLAKIIPQLNELIDNCLSELS